jgi:alpha-N-acetylglucosaminidase
LVDIARQTLANESRRLLPQIKAAYDGGDRRSFDSLTRHWLHLMGMQDQLLATNRFFLVGAWLVGVRSWASTPDEAARLDYDARSILTTWGDRKASEGAELHDYGNKDWAGLMRDYYRVRWRSYFASLDAELRTGRHGNPIDWFAVGDAWNHSARRYSDRPHGDAYVIAKHIAKSLNLELPRP